MGCNGAIRERALRDDLRYGEYAVPAAASFPMEEPEGRGAGEWKGEPGSEFTRRIRSDMGVDFVLGAMV